MPALMSGGHALVTEPCGDSIDRFPCLKMLNLDLPTVRTQNTSSVTQVATEAR